MPRILRHLPLALLGLAASSAPAGAAEGQERLVLELSEEVDPGRVLSDVRAIAPTAVLEARAQGHLQLGLPPGLGPALAALPGVRRARLPHAASPKAIESEGVAPIFEQVDWRDEGLTGAGVTVAVLDVGFAGVESLAEGEAPASITLVRSGGSSAHGTAVVEIIADLAPGAELRLYGFSTDVEFMEVLALAVADGADVINASIGFDNVSHPDGEGPLARAVDEAAGQGVVYVAAAGNEVGRYRSGLLSDADGDGILEIDGAPEVLLERAQAPSASLRWDEPFGAAGVDLDLELIDDDGLCDRGAEVQSGEGFPYEAATCVSPRGRVRARVRRVGGEAEGLRAWLYAPGGVDPSEPLAVEGTLTLPADARGALAVGGLVLDGPTLEPYSSQGPTLDGRLKPELVAASGVSTDTYGRAAFAGTSAAAPHVAGLAALLIEHRRHARPATVRRELLEAALDLGDEGPDNAFGHGAARAGTLPAPCGCAAGGSPPGALLTAGLLALARRRARVAGGLARPGATLYSSASLPGRRARRGP